MVRNPIKDLKKLANKDSIKEFKALFDTIQKLNENMLFIMRNQCEVEAYLSLIAEKLEVDSEALKARIDEIDEEFNFD